MEWTADKKNYSTKWHITKKEENYHSIIVDRKWSDQLRQVIIVEF